jgi:hypothetical protein
VHARLRRANGSKSTCQHTRSRRRD